MFSLSCIFSLRILSRHAFFHLTYLSTHFSLNTFFIADFLVIRPFISHVFSPGRFLTPFFHHPLLHHDFSRSSFSCRKFLLFFCCIFFFSETISIANLPISLKFLIYLALLYEPSFLAHSLSLSFQHFSLIHLVFASARSFVPTFLIFSSCLSKSLIFL